MSTPPAASVGGVQLPFPRSIHDLHRDFGGQLDPGLSDVVIRTVTSRDQGDANSLAPIFTSRAVRETGAGVLLVADEVASSVPQGRRWVHAHARWVLASLLRLAEPVIEPRISPRAVVEPGVLLGDRVAIGANAVLQSGLCVGDDCQIGPNAVLYGNVRLGHRVVVGAGAVIGRPGFGWATGPGQEVCRMPQLGGVDIEDDVELGALVTVDAGTLGPTLVRRGCKVDAHVHVGHNVELGPGSMIAAQSGFAGSARIGAGVLIGGQVGVADHVVVGDGARLAGKSGVIGNVAPGMTVAGYPAVERMRWLRSVATALRGRSK